MSKTAPRKVRTAEGAPEPDTIPAPSPAPARPRAPSKLDTVETLLLAECGSTIAEIMAATGWQQHSVRGAISGALRKRGLVITSDKRDGIRRYRAARPA